MEYEKPVSSYLDGEGNFLKVVWNVQDLEKIFENIGIPFTDENVARFVRKQDTIEQIEAEIIYEGYRELEFRIGNLKEEGIFELSSDQED